MFQKIKQEPFDTCIYKKMLLDYTYGLDKIYTKSEMEKAVLVASACGGKDGIPKPPEFKKLQSEIVNKTLNNISITAEEIKSLNSASLGS